MIVSRSDEMTEAMSHHFVRTKASWSDHARDMLYMINHFRQDMPRPLVGIGHSMGGNNLYDHSLLIEPVC